METAGNSASALIAVLRVHVVELEAKVADLEAQLAEPDPPVDPPPPPPPPPPVVWPPSGYVQLVPSDFVKGIEAHPAGTKFGLAGGSYGAAFPVKAGNMYQGDPSDRPTFKGPGPGSGTPLIRADVPDVTLRNIKASHFGPGNSDDASGMVDFQGGTGWLFEDCEFSHTNQNIMRWGNGWTVRRTHLHHGGRFAMTAGGKGAAKLIEDCKWSYVGMSHDGVTGSTSSNRGGNKFAVAANVTVRRLEIFESGWNGFWADIQNENFHLEDIYAHQIGRTGIFLEVSYGPFKVVRPRVDDFGRNDDRQGDPVISPAGILVSLTPDVEIVDPDINNGPNGIIAYQWQHPQVLGVKDGKPFGSLDKSRAGLENLLVHGKGRITNIERFTAGLQGSYQAGTRPTRNLRWDLSDITVDPDAQYRSPLHIT